jgi:hypothetical protein
MKPRTSLGLVSLLLAGACAGPAPAQEILPTTGIDLPVLGKIAPRHARDVKSSPWWSVGGETIDRDFTVFRHYQKYLGPLGVKSIRVQAGWAKCEKVKGVYDWAWLDEIVDGSLAQGVRPWLEFNYGNTIYPGGGDTGLGGGFPSSPEALAAWDRWCRALVERYQDRVHEWEVWNEPDLGRKSSTSVEAYIELYLRTATMVRAVQPRGRLWAMGLAGRAEYADEFLAGLKARGKLDLVDAITYHGYPRNPDDTTLADRLREVVKKHGRAIQLRQGETGAPSKYQENFALSRISWTETLQAKWNLRRLLAHRAKDIPMNMFTISDMHYTQASSQQTADGVLRMNYKGLLATNPDQTISHAKPAYFAAQAVFSIFDGALVRMSKYPFTSSALRALALTGYQRKDGAGQVVAYWFNDAPPDAATGVTRADLTLAAAKFNEPVVVDLRTGVVYAVPRDRWEAAGAGVKFKSLPVCDSPLLIAERSALPL